LHDEERRPVLLADVVQRADMGMIEGGDCAGFAIESIAELRVARQPGRQDFNRDDAIQARIAGAIDFAHPAGPNGRKDLVRAEAGAHSEGHFFSAAVQLSVTSSGTLSLSPTIVLTRNFCPCAATSTL